ncbi:MAG: 4Fe-4S binding protein [Candidatus Lokiarchaeota archaeon]|nr:4Fe-4S binding protein [Candidatus Lokiarchaeota archaeon]
MEQQDTVDAHQNVRFNLRQVTKLTLVRRIVQIFVIIFLNAVLWGSIFSTDLSFFETLFRYVPFLSSPRSTFSNSGGFLEIMLGSLVARITPFLVLGLVIIVAILFGRSPCGWMCPAGFIQDIFGWAGEATNNCRQVSVTSHPFLLRIKNWILGLLLLFIVPFIFITDNPTYTLYLQTLGDFAKSPLSFWSLDEFLFVFVPKVTNELAMKQNLDYLANNWLFIVQGLFYFIIVILAFYYPRVYCRYLCPYGALARPFAKHSIVALSRNPTKCVGRKECGECERVCPMQIRILDEPYARISGNGECILCGRCKDACDKKEYDAIELSFFK